MEASFSFPWFSSIDKIIIASERPVKPSSASIPNRAMLVIFLLFHCFQSSFAASSSIPKASGLWSIFSRSTLFNKD